MLGMISDSPRAAFKGPSGLQIGETVRILLSLRQGRDSLRELIEAVERRDMSMANVREQLRDFEKGIRDARRIVRSKIQ